MLVTRISLEFQDPSNAQSPVWSIGLVLTIQLSLSPFRFLCAVHFDNENESTGKTAEIFAVSNDINDEHNCIPVYAVNRNSFDLLLTTNTSVTAL